MPGPPPPTSRLIDARLMPPLDPGALVVTIDRVGRPTSFSPALLIRACDPSCVSGRSDDRLAKLSRKASSPFDFTCSLMSGSGASATCGTSADSGTISSGSSSASSGSGSGSGSGISSSTKGSGSGAGGGNSSRTSFAMRSGSSISFGLSVIGIATDPTSIPRNRVAMSDEPSDLR